MKRIYLEVISAGRKGTRYLLPEGAVSIGRSSKNTIVLPAEEKCVSGHHAIIYNSSDRILIQDLQSTNGTFINEELVQECEVEVGDEIRLGQTGPRMKLIWAGDSTPTFDFATTSNKIDPIRTTEETSLPLKKKPM